MAQLESRCMQCGNKLEANQYYFCSDCIENLNACPLEASEDICNDYAGPEHPVEYTCSTCKNWDFDTGCRVSRRMYDENSEGI